MSNLNKISVGIRDSELSRTQTNLLLNQLISVSDNMDIETFDIKTIKTKGDVHSEQRLDKIGGKGLFIKEIEEYNIGHFIIGESIFFGLNKIIKNFKKILR